MVLFHMSKKTTKQQQDRIRQLGNPKDQDWLLTHTSFNEILFSEGKKNDL